MRFVPANVHGVIDYAASIGLIVLPFVLGFTGIGLYLSVAAGVALFLYSLVTGYSLSVQKILPFPAHLAIDFSAGVAFMVAPFLLPFSNVEMIYYWVMGATICALVFVTNPEINAERATA